jgi:lipoprotein NlpD
MKSREFLPLLPVALALLVAGCASTVPAPVSDGRTKMIEKPTTVAPATPAAAPAPATRGPSYTVKKGDTLYAIALDHGLDYKDLIVWNGLDNPNLILVDQVLRLSAADASAQSGNGAVVKPIAPPASLEAKPAKPAETAAASPSVAMSTESLKREPKGGKLAYSTEAFERLRRVEAGKPGDPPPAVSVTAAGAQTEAPVTAAPVAVQPPTPPLPVSAPASMTASLIEWSWPVAGAVIAPFNEGTNKGIDLAGKLGEPVGAAAAGKVVYAGSGLRGYGKLVIVRHSADYLSAYAHAKEILVKEGQTVSRLQKIAEVGDTDADRPKLHFEVRYRGVPVDPQKHLPGR